MEYMRFKNASLSVLLQNEIIKDDEVRFFFQQSFSLIGLSSVPRLWHTLGIKMWVFFFLKLLIYLFGCIGLSCGKWDLSLKGTDSLVVARMFSSWGTRASCFEAYGILVP